MLPSIQGRFRAAFFFVRRRLVHVALGNDGIQLSARFALRKLKYCPVTHHVSVTVRAMSGAFERGHFFALHHDGISSHYAHDLCNHVVNGISVARDPAVIGVLANKQNLGILQPRQARSGSMGIDSFVLLNGQPTDRDGAYPLSATDFLKVGFNEIERVVVKRHTGGARAA